MQQRRAQPVAPHNQASRHRVRRRQPAVSLPEGQVVAPRDIDDVSARSHGDGHELQGTRHWLKRFSNRPCTTWGGRGTSARTDAGGPMRASSMDLRERALLDSDAGMKAADVAAKHRVSGSWVRLLKQRRRETGEVAPRVQRHGRRCMLEPHLHTLADLIAAHPDRTLAELKDAVRLEFPILSLNPGLRQRCVAPGVWPTRNGMATRSGTLARIRLRAAVRRQSWRKRVGTPAMPRISFSTPRHVP